MSIEGYLKSTENKPRTFKNVAGKLLAEKEPEDTRPWRWEDEIGEINWKSGQAALQVYDVNSMQFPYLVASMSSIDPTRVHIDKNKLRELMDQLHTHKIRGNWFRYVLLATQIHTIKPKLLVDLDDKFKKGIARMIDINKNEQDCATYFDFTSYLFPRDPTHPPEIDVAIPPRPVRKKA